VTAENAEHFRAQRDFKTSLAVSNLTLAVVTTQSDNTKVPIYCVHLLRGHVCTADLAQGLEKIGYKLLSLHAFDVERPQSILLSSC